ncbi:MAG: hypothetical protein KJ697_02740 [Nanoarchaeota archaeon]|nr:hypothetical protein [Nanoarchaeota archaeon]MBU4124099.1 hypothetical protein [Nanoarchaeota archaeon]
MSDTGVAIGKISKRNGSKVKLPRSYIRLASLGCCLSFDIYDKRVVAHTYEEDNDFI